jgi:HypF finger protein
VLNNSLRVLIDVEEPQAAIEGFLEALKSSPPTLARIDSLVLRDDLGCAHYNDFRIVESSDDVQKLVPVSADVGTCADCIRELFDSHNHRFRYPFINCTNCGPRFTIIEDVPYDRAKTTLLSVITLATWKTSKPLNPFLEVSNTSSVYFICSPRWSHMTCTPNIYRRNMPSRWSKLKPGSACSIIMRTSQAA